VRARPRRSSCNDSAVSRTRGARGFACATRPAVIGANGPPTFADGSFPMRRPASDLAPRMAAVRSRPRRRRADLPVALRGRAGCRARNRADLAAAARPAVDGAGRRGSNAARANRERRAARQDEIAQTPRRNRDRPVEGTQAAARQLPLGFRPSVRRWRCCTASRPAFSRAMISFMICAVPSPISRPMMSRRRCWWGRFIVYP